MFGSEIFISNPTGHTVIANNSLSKFDSTKADPRWAPFTALRYKELRLLNSAYFLLCKTLKVYFNYNDV